MKWLIAGANGQLGRCLQENLGSRGIDFVALSRSDLDITNIDRVEHLIKNIKPDVVVNAAAYTNVELAETDSEAAFKVNHLGATNLATASRSINANLVHFSTDYVFSGHGNSPWHVNDLKEPLSIYGKSKLAGEVEILKVYPEKSLIIRTAWLHSPFGKNFYKTMLTKALSNDESVRVINDQQGQPTNAYELAGLTLSAVTKNVAPGIFHGTNADSCSWFEFAKYIFEIAGADPARITPVLSSEFATKAQRPKYSVLDNQKWSEFGILPLGPWQDSVRKALPSMLQALSK